MSPGTRAEQLLAITLGRLAEVSGSSSAILRLFFKGMKSKRLSRPQRDALIRMDLDKPRNLRDFFYSRLLRGIFRRG